MEAADIFLRVFATQQHGSCSWAHASSKASICKYNSTKALEHEAPTGQDCKMKPKYAEMIFKRIQKRWTVRLCMSAAEAWQI